MAKPQKGAAPAVASTQALGDAATAGAYADGAALATHKHGMPSAASVATSVSAQSPFARLLALQRAHISQ